MLTFNLVGPRSQSGASLVELAIILPLLMVLALGFAEFGLAFYRLNTLNKAVEDGARYFADPLISRQDGNPINPIDTSSSNPYYDDVQNIVVYGQPTVGSTILPGFVPANITLCAGSACSPAISTDHFRLTATYSHNFIVGATLNRLMNVLAGSPSNATVTAITMTASTVMRVE